MKQWSLLLLGLVVAIIFAFAGYQLQQYQGNTNTEKQTAATEHPPATPRLVVGTILEEFSLLDVDGQRRNISEWKGKVRVLNFWATWCGPCREEVPAFVALQQQYQSKGLQFIGIALQEADEVRSFLKEFNVNYPSLLGVEEVISLANQLGNDIGALPYTVFVGRDDRVAFTHRGAMTKEEAEKIIQTLL